MSMKKKIVAGLLMMVAVVTVIACSNTYLGRYIRWNFPDVYDLTKFPSVPIQQSGETRLFVKSLQPSLTDMNVKLEGATVPLKDLLSQSKTRAFIVLRNDTIIAENFADAGVSGVVAGFSLHEELELLVQAGLTPKEALKSATTLPSQWLGIDKQIGTIETGKFAYLILLDENPLEGIKNTHKTLEVYLSMENG